MTGPPYPEPDPRPPYLFMHLENYQNLRAIYIKIGVKMTK